MKKQRTALDNINWLYDKYFCALTDINAIYDQIIEIGRQLPPPPAHLCTEKNKVSGCQSQVWLDASTSIDALGNITVHYIADSDALIVRGLVALLLHIYNECTLDDIIEQEPLLFGRIGLDKHLSITRSNGLAKIIKQIKMYALVLKGVATS